jgi:hypothetical protein
MKSRWVVAPLLCMTAAIAVVVIFSSLNRAAIRAERANLVAASLRYPRYTLAQRMGILRESVAERHPRWRDLSLAELAHRIMMFAGSSTATTTAPSASFSGNLTAITAPAGDLAGLFRQPNCSLTLNWASYTLSMPSATYLIEGTTPNYDQVLHSTAGLTTSAGNWPAGCGDPLVGITARKVAYLGTTASGDLVAADVGFYSAMQEQVIFTFNGPVANSTANVGIIPISGESPVSLVAANLAGGSGIADLVVVNESNATSGGAGSISVIPVDATGTFGTAVSYPLPGQQGLSAVVDDFNGDGKLDIVATSSTFVSGTSTTYYLTYLQGKGDGTFANPQNVTLTPPSSAGQQYFGLISADLRNSGKKDVISSAGVVLFGNGDGTFTQSPTAAFPSEGGTSEFGPNVVAGDFNKDGKLDLALDDGVAIKIFLGNGDGTFAAHGAYATINNTGYLTGADLDGDGNVDLYSGVARGGAFGGDQFEINQSYALMGNGDGSFRGAPVMPFAFTGTNLMDLNGDKVPDGVGVNSTPNSTNVTMTSYVGSSNGIFTPKQTLTVSPVSINGTTFQFYTLDSFGLGDVTGDGIPDLVYLPSGFSGPGGIPGYFLATGKGDGTFNTPTYIAAPGFTSGGQPDQGETLGGLFVADVNSDGKADLIYGYLDNNYQTGNFADGIAVQLSNGDGTFQAPKVIQIYAGTSPVSGSTPQVVQMGHTRPGGPLDLFALQQANTNGVVSETVELFPGNGDGTFGPATTPKVADDPGTPSFGSALGQIALADMNGDGKPDLITLGTTTDGSTPELAISLGNGDGTFQPPTILKFASGSSLGFGLAAADFNGDGKMDIAVTGFNPPVDTGIFLGNGDGTVQSFSPYSGLTEPAEAINLVLFGAAEVTDYNGDGKPDLVAGQGILLNQAGAATLTPTTTTVSASASTVTVGTSVTLTATVSASSTPAGSVTFVDGSTALGTANLDGTGKAMYAASNLAIGSHSITARYAGNSTFAGSTSVPVTVTVSAMALPGTTSVLAVSANSVASGTGVTFTDTVAAAAGATGTPTGTVTFMDGTANIGTATLSGSGVATSQATVLQVGTHTITAVYAGDTAFSGSTSNAVTVTVNAVAPSFTLSASPNSATVTAGTSATTTITLTPAGGFNSPVSFACSSQPVGPTCTFSPATVTPNGAAATTTLTIGTTQAGALSMPPRPGSRSGGASTVAVLAAGALWVFGRKKKAPWQTMMPLTLVLLLIAGVAVGCGGSSGGSSNGGGGGGGSQPKTYVVTVTGAAGGLNETTTFTLTVN